MAHTAKAAAAFADRVTSSTCHFILGTQDHPLAGQECNIFAFEANGRKIAIRVQQHLFAWTRAKVEQEVQVLEALTRAEIPLTPRLLGYDLESSPPMIATTWADGEQLTWTDAGPPQHVREQIIRSIAGVTLDLLQINRPGCSALEWITSKIDRTRTQRAKRGELHGIFVDDCEALQHRILGFHVPEYDDLPHILVHGDLHRGNMIINGDELECILDWGFATMMPLQYAVAYPRFLTNEPFTTDETIDWSRSDYSPTQKRDRAFYLECIRNIAAAKGEHLARVYAELLGREKEQEFHWRMTATTGLHYMRAVKTMPSTFE